MFDPQRYEEIMALIDELSDEALEMLPQNSQEAARGYWYAQIKMAINHDHGYLGRCLMTMNDSMSEAEEFIDYLEDDDLADIIREAQNIDFLLTKLYSLPQARDRESNVFKLIDQIEAYTSLIKKNYSSEKSNDIPEWWKMQIIRNPGSYEFQVQTTHITGEQKEDLIKKGCEFFTLQKRKKNKNESNNV